MIIDNQFVETPTRKLVSGTNLTLKVDRFNGFVNRISKADFMIAKTCSLGVIFDENF